MRIGFDISQTGSTKAGCGYFADSLIKELAKIDSGNQYVLYKTFGDSFWDPCANDISGIHQANFKFGLKHSSLEAAQNFWQNLTDDYGKQLGQPDIIHSNNFFCPERKIEHAKFIFTLYDLSFLEHPESTTERNRLTCFNGVFNASLNADFIIAISNYSRRHFLATFPHYSADKIQVVYPASRFTKIIKQERPKRFAQFMPEQFWLNVGTLEPRKNQYRLLQAYAKLKAQQKQAMPLVLAGGEGWLMDDFKKKVVELGLQQDVHWVGYADDAELQWLYQNCFCLVYPSLFEGFGLPVLEAMTLGAPVITSNVSSIPEIVGSSGILIDPFKEDEIVHAMFELVTEKNKRNRLREQALKQANQFSWVTTAKSILEIYNQALAR
jgi:glycosyltransferase involved in cell wall biosynthesis